MTLQRLPFKDAYTGHLFIVCEVSEHAYIRLEWQGYIFRCVKVKCRILNQWQLCVFFCSWVDVSEVEVRNCNTCLLYVHNKNSHLLKTTSASLATQWMYFIQPGRHLEFSRMILPLESAKSRKQDCGACHVILPSLQQQSGPFDV